MKNEFSKRIGQGIAGEILFRPAAVSILMPPSFDIPSFNSYTPWKSKIAQKLTLCQQFGLQVHKKAVFRCFFYKRFSRPNYRPLPLACHTYLESLCISGQFRISGNIFSASYEASEQCKIAPRSPQHLPPFQTRQGPHLTWKKSLPAASGESDYSLTDNLKSRDASASKKREKRLRQRELEKETPSFPGQF